MIVDSSALLAILFREAEGEVFFDAILQAPRVRMATASYLEVGLRIDRLLGEVDPRLDELVKILSIELAPVTGDHGRVAREASVRYGRRPASLNFGDCLTYALAKTTGEPLLFKGNDFSQTDLPRAVAAA